VGASPGTSNKSRSETTAVTRSDAGWGLEVAGARGVFAKRFERAALAAKRLEIVSLYRRAGDLDNSIGRGKRQRSQDDGVDHAKERGRRAGRQRQAEHCDDRDDRILHERSRAEPRVLRDLFKGHL
jgi:hypothetical protein